MSEINDELLSRFVEAPTNVAKLNLVLDYNEKKGILPLLFKDGKDDELATGELDCGNDSFRNGDLEGALNSYTKALAFTQSSLRKAQAHASRAAVLIKLGLYKECITECDRALEAGYPENLKGRLIQRKQRAEDALTQHPQKLHHETTPSCRGTNSFLSSAADTVRMEEDEVYGKHIVAEKCMRVGKVLLVEKPYATLLYSNVKNHCHNCLEICYTMIPCEKCTEELYCSTECKDEAFQAFHKYECAIGKTLENQQATCPWLKPMCLRIALIGRREILMGEDSHPEDKRMRSDRFRDIYNLQSDQNELELKSAFNAASAVSIMYYLVKKYTDLLQSTEQENRFKDAMMKLYFIVRLNSFTVTELQQGNEPYRESHVGTAIYANASLFNHSCSPNVFACFFGRTLVLTTCATIKEGEQCCIAYVPPYYVKEKWERQDYLAKHYHFRCRCTACRLNWPTLNKIQTEGPAKLLGSMRVPYLCNAFRDKVDVEFAKTQRTNLQSGLKEAEKFEASRSHATLTELFIHCYLLFGNKGFKLQAES